MMTSKTYASAALELGPRRIAFYDSDDKANRRRVLELWLSRPTAQRGKLYEAERAHPGDTWPPMTPLGTGYSIATVESMARRLGLTSREEGRG